MASWNDPRDFLNPPEEGSVVEIRTQRDDVIPAVYLRGEFFISAEGVMTVAYANPKGWRPRGNPR